MVKLGYFSMAEGFLEGRNKWWWLTIWKWYDPEKNIVIFFVIGRENSYMGCRALSWMGWSEPFLLVQIGLRDDNPFFFVISFHSLGMVTSGLATENHSYLARGMYGRIVGFLEK
jgi:hypothetical protein